LLNLLLLLLLEEGVASRRRRCCTSWKCPSILIRFLFNCA
jgi:hypothetical protein